MIPLLAGSAGLLRFDRAQTLTEAESAQARANIGATVNGFATDLNALTESGVYIAYSAVSVAAGFPVGSAVVQHLAFSPLAAVQLWSSVINGSLGLTYRRVRSGGVWGTPRIMWDAANLLGTVAQTGGVPTGSVIERGSNGNGEYVRFADGTQLCTSTDTAGQTAATAAGALYAGAAKTWTFPVAFVAAPVVTGSAAGAGRWLNAYATSATQASYRQWAAVSDSAAVAAQLQATGRWF